jgi:competence protein ComEC
MTERDRAQQRAKGRVDTWPEPRIRGWRGTLLPHPGDLLQAAVEYLKAAAATDFGPGRLTPWLPVAFGLGVAVYFTAEREPWWMAALAAFFLFAALAYLARRRPVAFPLALVLTAFAAGFALITLRTAIIAHPVLDRPVFGASVTGFVEAREERERSDRIVIRVHKLDGTRMAAPPERVRLSVRRGAAPAVGSFISLKARLSPPLAPLRPGGYDFARDLYFQKIGAVGFVTGAIKIETPPEAQGLKLRYAAMVDGIRDGIDKRIRASVTGDGGAIASALITGKRDAISTPVNDAMYVSSLAHVLSISGYHMALVAGVVFFVVRAGLALIPGFSSRHPTKKWGAIAALVAATLYLALSGAEVATQRSYVMTAVVLAGVLFDRAALTLRTLAVAAFAVLLITPEAVAHPSFQMSFAATLALVAAYERGLPWASGGADTSFGARVALWGGREIAALIFASVVAGLATTPYAAFHFHRVAPYGVIANLLAMPIVSIVVMPAGLLALIAMPFGLDGPLWRLMGGGIDWMISVALWVTSLPGAVGRVTAFGVGALLLMTAGMVVLCLLRSRLRYAGTAIILAGCGVAYAATRPDVLIAANGDAVAVRTGDGRLTALKLSGSAFTIRDWLAGDGDMRTPDDKALASGFACDETGCIARLADNSVIAVSRTAAALAEDCKTAALVITPRDAPPACAAMVLDRKALRARGAMDIRRVGGGWQIEAAMPPGTDRPWARGSTVEATPAAATVRPAARNAPARDATPRTEDMEADD